MEPILRNFNILDSDWPTHVIRLEKCDHGVPAHPVATKHSLRLERLPRAYCFSVRMVNIDGNIYIYIYIGLNIRSMY